MREVGSSGARKRRWTARVWRKAGPRRQSSQAPRAVPSSHSPRLAQMAWGVRLLAAGSEPQVEPQVEAQGCAGPGRRPGLQPGLQAGVQWPRPLRLSEACGLRPLGWDTRSLGQRPSIKSQGGQAPAAGAWPPFLVDGRASHGPHDTPGCSRVVAEATGRG